MKFLDTNVIIRFLTRDDPVKASACYRLFQRAATGAERLFTTEAIVAEVTYVLTSSRLPYQLTHREIRDRLIPIIALDGLMMPRKEACISALEIYASFPYLDFEDALAVAYMKQRGIEEIVSYDADFDRVAGIERTEP